MIPTTVIMNVVSRDGFKIIRVLKKIFEITREIADLGFGEKDIHEIAKDEDLYIRYEEWRKSNKTESI